uniref:Uncharacterized protein n=1 Tax=Anguilla anguilla TaxID=7936 RepID=A0A0E9V0J2_ANGAN
MAVVTEHLLFKIFHIILYVCICLLCSFTSLYWKIKSKQDFIFTLCALVFCVTCTK